MSPTLERFGRLYDAWLDSGRWHAARGEISDAQRRRWALHGADEADDDCSDESEPPDDDDDDDDFDRDELGDDPEED